MEDEEAAVTVPSLRNTGFRDGILSMSTANGVSSAVHGLLALAGLHGDGRDLVGEVAVADRALRATHRLGGERVLGGAREAVLVRGGFREAAHRLAVPRALQPVVEHVVDQLGVTHAVSGSGLEQQVGRIAHRLEPARQRERGAAGADLVRRQHQGVHAGAAHLVHGRGRHGGRDAGGERGLACGRLPEACRQHAAEDHLVEGVARQAGVGQRGPGGRAAELGGRGGREHALEAADRCAPRGQDHDFFVHCGLSWGGVIHSTGWAEAIPRECKPG